MTDFSGSGLIGEQGILPILKFVRFLNRYRHLLADRCAPKSRVHSGRDGLVCNSLRTVGLASLDGGHFFSLVVGLQMGHLA